MAKKFEKLTATLLLCVPLAFSACKGIGNQNHEHDYTSSVTAPTCTELGYTTYTCKTCDDTYKDSYVNALGHKPALDQAVEPTCTDKGLTIGVHCETCSEVIIAQSETAPKHDWSTWKEISPATCYVDGERKHVCIRCEHEETETVAKLEHNFVTDEETDVTSCQTCGAIQFNGNIYQVFAVELNWTDAKAYCENLGGHLATVTSAEEQAMLELLVGSSTDYWLGGEKINGEYVWITGEEFVYEHWASGEPNNENGVEDKIEFQGDHYWNDLPSSTSNGYLICEWEGTEE